MSKYAKRAIKSAWIDYPRLNFEQHSHHTRYQKYVESQGLVCQACGGRGEYDRGFWEPPDYCGWCESTGYVTRWLRGQWLRYCKGLKRNSI